MKRKSLLTTLLTFTMLLSLVVPSLVGAKDKVRDLNDLGDAQWASRHINKLVAEEVINGYEDNSFRPNKPVTRAEAVVMALKATNPTLVTEQVYASALPFKDANSIPAWAAGYINQAVTKGYLPGDVGSNFQANKPATRLWTAMLLVRVQNLTDQVYGQQNSVLPFKDVAKLSTEQQAYVAVAMANNLLVGYPDKTFKPNKPVTRAELAVMLGKAGEEIPLPGTTLTKQAGTVVAITPAQTTSEEVADSVYEQVADSVYNDVYSAALATITIKDADGKETTYKVAENAKIFVDNKKIKLSALAIGTRVELILGKEGTVIYVEARPESYVGTLVVADSVYGKLTLSVRGQEQSFSLAAAPTVTINDKTAALTDLKAGMQVKIQLTDGKVSSIKAVVFEQKTTKQKPAGQKDSTNQKTHPGGDKNTKKAQND